MTLCLMPRKIELLAPGGSVDSIKAAIIAGADAVYCGLDKFNARNRAENIVFADLNGILRLAHQYNCKVFLTLNILIVDSEIPALIRLLNKLVQTSIDGVIVQDLGLLYLLVEKYPSLVVHGSTQLTTHNEGQVRFLNLLAATRVNLARELSLQEIGKLSRICHENNMAVEVFVHGSLCLSFSGLCYLSSVQSGNSGNRGRCSQPCRDQYATTAVGVKFPLNLKDNSAYAEVGDLVKAGVDSLKIEGRIKKFHYVHTVVKAFREQLQRLDCQRGLQSKSAALYTVFNRDFTNGFLQAEIGKDMFIDYPRDYSAHHLAGVLGGITAENTKLAKRELYARKTAIITEVGAKIDRLSAIRGPVDLSISGRVGEVLRVVVKTPESAWTFCSTTPLALQKKSGGSCFGSGLFLEKFKAINDTEYMIRHLDLKGLQGGAFVPFRELSQIKDKILNVLRDGQQAFAPFTPAHTRAEKVMVQPALSLLISSPQDISLGDDIDGEIYFELPSRFDDGGAKLRDLFTNNKKLIPWFPPVLIGDDYLQALELLRLGRPNRIVTNNTGIAYAAMEEKIPWVAGPYLNITNSFSLLCLQEKLNCSGAFIANELSRQQVKKIRRPPGFKLYYSMYHPIVLMTSRQCLLSQVRGCAKDRVDATCVERCHRSAVIEGGPKGDVLISKRRGQHHSLYHQVNSLNTAIVNDVPGLFSGFCIDLRHIETETKLILGRAEIVRLFAEYLGGNLPAGDELQEKIRPTTNIQYERGI